MPPIKRHYYIDEAGDGVLFNKRGRIIIGTKGNSRFFMLGLLHIEDPPSLERRLSELRRDILSNPYFAGVPSLQPENRKTALAFHAKDDLPEIHKMIFDFLHDTMGLRFYALVRDKKSVLAEVRRFEENRSEYRYNPNELYERMVPRLLRDHLHKADEIDIVFARRGRKPRTQALLRAIERARRNFYRKHKILSDSSINIEVGRPDQYGGLQAVDYFLWALQRLYERGEDRYLKYLWHHVHSVVDVDDRRERGYGVYYGQKVPLDAASLAWRTEK